VRELIEAPGDAKITDLHVWRVGPEAKAAIVEVAGKVSPVELRERVKPVHEIAHLTVAVH
jgi:Co/Zn/Cd efflux system component